MSAPGTASRRITPVTSGRPGRTAGRSLAAVTPATTAGSTPVRLGWALSDDGEVAVCKLLGPDGGLRLERRRPFAPAEGARLLPDRLLPSHTGLDLLSPLLVGDDGEVVSTVAEPGGRRVVRWGPDGRLSCWPVLLPNGTSLRRLTVPGGSTSSPGPSGGSTSSPGLSGGSTSSPGPSGGSTSSPGLSGGSTSSPGMALEAYVPDGTTTSILRIGPEGSELLAHVPHPVLTATSLDADTRIVNVLGAAGSCRAVRFDLSSGRLEDFFEVSERSDDRVLVARADLDLVVVSTNAGGERRIGWGRLSDGRLGFPAAGASDRAVQLLAVDDDGTRLALVEERGMTSLVRSVDLSSGLSTPVPLPPLVLAGRGALRGRGDATTLTVPVSSPDHPGAVLRTSLSGPGRVEFDEPGQVLPRGWAGTGRPSWSIRRLPGPAGAVEAIVFGDPLAADRVVVALHGGPFAAWRASHHPLFETLAVRGIAVVAPNVRGSTGYGAAHTRAIWGRWGEPDVEDVRAIGDWLRSRRAGRAAPVLIGESYGAYLGLLTAAVDDPGCWSGCAALCPFVSGAAVAGFGTRVSDLVRRSGGESSPDLLRLGQDIDVPVLLLHGDQDDVVPVGQSVLLAQALANAGVPVDLVRDPSGGHDLICGPSGVAHRERLARFAAEPGADTATTTAGPSSRRTERR